MQNHIMSGRTIPRLAMINDFTGFGRCSTAVSLPVISALKVQVCPVPTSILSNHLGFPTCSFHDYTSHMREYLHGWEQLGIRFDGLYCGFLGSVEQISIVKELLQGELFRSSDCRALFLLDPVLGDHGNIYSTITPQHCAGMKELLSYADILTPNITEACLLTDTPYKDVGWTDYELAQICHKLAGTDNGPTQPAAPTVPSGLPDGMRHTAQPGVFDNLPSHNPEYSSSYRLIRQDTGFDTDTCTQINDTGCCPAKRIVITGLRNRSVYLNYIWEDGQRSIYESPITGASRPGTGDLFASILVGDALNHIAFTQSVQKAADFTALCIQGSEKAAIPVQEGVIFEQYLDRLIIDSVKE